MLSQERTQEFIDLSYISPIVGSPLPLVLESLQGVRDRILATMDLAEEVATPLSADYHQTVADKIKAGIKVYRLGFGTQKDFLEITRRYSMYPSDNPNYRFQRIGDTNAYQRMNLIDDNLFFKTDSGFYFSQNAEVIAAFTTYFYNHFLTA